MNGDGKAPALADSMFYYAPIKQRGQIGMRLPGEETVQKPAGEAETITRGSLASQSGTASGCDRRPLHTERIGQILPERVG